jgi:hypothetical protein
MATSDQPSIGDELATLPAAALATDFDPQQADGVDGAALALPTFADPSPLAMRQPMAADPAQTVDGIGTAVVVAEATRPSSTVATDAARLADALADMSKPNEIVPEGIAKTARWRYGANVTMGTEPYASAIPSWWKPGIRFPEWRAMVPWFVIYPEEGGNPSTNTAVEVSGIEFWVLTETSNAWEKLEAAAVPAWQKEVGLKGQSPRSAQTIQSSADSRAFLPSSDFMIHAGLPQVAVPWIQGRGANVKAMLVSVRHRLIVANPALPDDRSTARLGFSLGIDYYPWLGATVKDLKAKYVPAAGVSRFIKITTEWRHSTLLIAKKGVTPEEILSIPPPALQ